jgi:hypothetical protein
MRRDSSLMVGDWNGATLRRRRYSEVPAYAGLLT